MEGESSEDTRKGGKIRAEKKKQMIHPRIYILSSYANLVSLICDFSE